jgi:hypothetical protein
MLSPDKREALEALLLSGGSIRMARRKLGVSINTARRYGKMVFREGIYCPCGQNVTHRGFCPFRFMSDGYEERRKFMKQWHGSRFSHCIDCGIGRNNKIAGLRCASCFKKQTKARALAWAAEKRACCICDKINHRQAVGSLPKACNTEWCQRLYAFYYLEGRSRPPLVQGGKNNGLRFEYLLSDYLRRLANEKSGKKYHRAA